MFEYIKKTIDSKDSASSKNMIALLAAGVLCLGFLYMVVKHPESPHILSISGSLALLCTFHKDATNVQ
jgi:hypothetical protein